MGLISFLFFQCKTAFSVNTCHVISDISQLFPLFDVDHLELASCSNLTIVYPLGNFGQALCFRSCHEDLISKRKSHNCAGIAFIQEDAAGGSKLIEQTLLLKMHKKHTRFYRFLLFTPVPIEKSQFWCLCMMFNHLKTNSTKSAHYRLKIRSYGVFLNFCP